MKKLCMSLLLFFMVTGTVWAGATHAIVPLGDPVYNLLRFGEIKGYINTPLPIKPYSKSVIVDALEEMLTYEDELSGVELARIESALAELTEPTSFGDVLSNGVLLHSEEQVGENNAPISATIGMGASFEMGGNLGALKRDFVNLNTFKLYLEGDLGTHLSYRVLGNLMVNNINNPHIIDIDGDPFVQGSSADNVARNPQYEYLDFRAYAPFTFSKSWDGNHNGGSTWFTGSQGNTVNWFPQRYALAYAFYSDISASFLEDRVQLRFGRDRHSIGPVENGIFLSPQARPFAALEVATRITDWLRISSIAGTLEYYYSELDHVNNPNKYVDREGESRAYMYMTMSQQQKMYSATAIELNPVPWLTLGVVESVVFPKRFELGYLNPFIFSFLYQSGIGDYDNTMLGGYAAVQIMDYGRVYGAINLDEARPGTSLFKNARNTFAYQLGAEGTIPGLDLSMITLQYTKIEPFTFTHNRVVVPNLTADSLDDPGIDVSFSHNGEGLPSYLKPNSDELLLDFEMALSNPLTIGARYQMIRHGWLGEYNKNVDGNEEFFAGSAGGEYNTALEYEGTAYKNRPKKFLRDGTYEWFHVFGVRGEYNFLEQDIPLTLGASLSLVHRFVTTTPDTDGDGYLNLGEKFEYKDGSKSTRVNFFLSASYWL